MKEDANEDVSDGEYFLGYSGGNWVVETPEKKFVFDSWPSAHIKLASDEISAVVHSGEEFREKRDEIVSQYHATGAPPRDDLRALVVFIYATIEEYSSQLIRKYLVADRFGQDTYGYFFNDMSQPHREELLKSGGIYNDSIIGRIGNFRGVRNTLVHEPHTAIDWEERELEKVLDSGIDITDRLYEALTEEQIERRILSDEDFNL